MRADIEHIVDLSKNLNKDKAEASPLRNQLDPIERRIILNDQALNDILGRMPVKDLWELGEEIIANKEAQDPSGRLVSRISGWVYTLASRSQGDQFLQLMQAKGKQGVRQLVEQGIWKKLCNSLPDQAADFLIDEGYFTENEIRKYDLKPY